MKKVYISLGSNLDDPMMQIFEAVDRIRQTPGIIVNALSSFYLSKPMGDIEQPDFINAVLEIETNFSAEELLHCLQRIETVQKRVRTERWGPRTIDLDILLFGDEAILTDELEVPHPGLSQREFVVYPLAEIAPNLQLPWGESIGEIKAHCPKNGLTIVREREEETVE